MSFNILAVPAILGLVLKLWVLYIARDRVRSGWVFYGLLLAFVAQNLWEVIGFFEKDTGIPMEWYFRTYYAILLLVTAFIVAHALEVSRVSTAVRQKLGWGIASYALLLSLLIFASDLIVEGYREAAYTLTAIQGEYYFSFQLFTLSTVTIVLSALILGYMRAKDRKTELQNLYMLFALAPMILLSLAVTALLVVGISINMAAIFPLATTFFVGVLALSEKEHGITDIRIYLPYSAERTLIGKLVKAGARFSVRKTNFKDTATSIEKALLLYSLSKNDFTVSKAAKDMDINRTTLYSICRRHDIELEDAPGKSE